MVDIKLIIGLLIAFQIKHVLADYVLQFGFMYANKGNSRGSRYQFNITNRYFYKYILNPKVWKNKPHEIPTVRWIDVLAIHAGIHGLLTACIIVWLPISWMWILGLITFDILIHMFIDRIKAHPKLGGKYTPDKKMYWVCLGLDQMCHHITHYIIILSVVTLLT